VGTGARPFVPARSLTNGGAPGGPDPGVPVPAVRFDQKNEAFKRRHWDAGLTSPGRRTLYEDVVFGDRVGYRKLDYAFRNASWHLEWSSAFGNDQGNSGLYAWDGMPEKVRAYAESGGKVEESPAEMSRLLKKVARFLGADKVGIAEVHPNWVYSHEFNLKTKEHYPIELPEGCDTAIVLAVAMDYDVMRSSPSAAAGAATGLGYSRMAFAASNVAAFIRQLGYRAVPSGNDTALSVPLALAAGLGDWSRMGLLVTPEFGPRVRLCKVFTDLPLVPDRYEPLGVVEFCGDCETCAQHCPSQALPLGGVTEQGPNISSHSGVRKWYIDAVKCHNFWLRNATDCSVCIRVCPFNKPAGGLHDLVRGAIHRTTLLNRLFVRFDRLLGYDKRVPAQRFWSG